MADGSILVATKSYEYCVASPTHDEQYCNSSGTTHLLYMPITLQASQRTEPYRLYQ